MAEIHRTPQDVYALVIPQSPLEENYEVGQEVTIPQSDRVERIVSHGWIEHPTEDGNGMVEATLTHTGAAILNYWSDQQAEGYILEALEKGVGEFVEEALEASMSVEDVESWEVVEMDDERLVLRGETSNDVVIERVYDLVAQEERHPQTA